MTTFLIVTVALGVVGFIGYAIVGSTLDAIRGFKDRRTERNAPLPCEETENDPDLDAEEKVLSHRTDLEEYGYRTDSKLSDADVFNVLRALQTQEKRGGFPCPKCRKLADPSLGGCYDCGKPFSEKPFRFTRQKDGRVKIQFVG